MSPPKVTEAIVIRRGLAMQGVRLITLKGALSLECAGLRHSRGSVYALVKREFGFRGNKASVLDQLKAHITEFNKEHGFTT